MQRWKAAALASVLCSSVLSIWLCRDGLLLSHRLGPALAPLRRLPRTLDARIARLAQYRALLQGAPDAVELRELTPWAGRPPGRRVRRERVRAQPCCRPTAYEDEVSFLDVHSRYHTVRELSARECACV
ncbi:PREDICTED: neurturin [Ceratotherium simum simum]|uniref:Neurturin n=1 Tax=Ceratotherium simum simum TaxID=73337 RepID=A0ABM1DHZ4_CERSS|nr:PREDICTED: neurturin [Ceratotherium simum simum]